MLLPRAHHNHHLGHTRIPKREPPRASEDGPIIQEGGETGQTPDMNGPARIGTTSRCHSSVSVIDLTAGGTSAVWVRIT